MDTKNCREKLNDILLNDTYENKKIIYGKCVIQAK